MGGPLKVDGIEVLGTVNDTFSQILTPEALKFIGTLSREFESQRKSLLLHRQKRQTEIDNGKLPDFLPETQDIRESDWKVAPIPDDLKDRRVEITGPVDRKMIINALNSGASTYMADFEDSHCPTWTNTIDGQIIGWTLEWSGGSTLKLNYPEFEQVGILRLDTACTASIRQARTGSPSQRMVQAPQTPCSQPTWVPVSCR